MFNKSIGKLTGKTSHIASHFESVTLNSIRNTLPDHAITEACIAAGHRYRIRRITPVLTVLHMIAAAIWPEDSFAASWQLIWSTFVAAFPHVYACSPSRGDVANARKRLPRQVWSNLFAWLSQQAQTASASVACWRSHRVIHVDGTCLTLCDKPDVREAFGVPRGKSGDRRYPMAKLVCVSLAETMTVIAYRLGCYRDDENALLNPLLASLQKGDLLVADRHYAGANLYWKYMQHGLEYVTRMHQHLIVSRLKRLWTYSENDFVAKMKIGDAYRRRDPSLPASLAVRFICVQARVRGHHKCLWFATSLLDAGRYPAAEVARLYLQRWRIETLLRQFKVDCGADVLRSQTVDGIHKEAAARLCAINIVRMIMLEAAVKNDVDPLRISFVHAMRTILAFAPLLAVRPICQLPAIYRAMLVEIAAGLVPERPGRLEPRSITHDRGYPKLKTTRAQWRQQHAA